MSSREKSVDGLIKVLRFNREEAERFLSALWFYPTVDAWYELRIIGERARSVWCKNYNECIEYVEKKWERVRDKHIYFGVLPRENFDENEIGENGVPRGGGKKKHVERGVWLWADYDCKREVNENELSEEIKQELNEKGIYIINREGGALEAYIKVDNKIIYINKPSHQEIIELTNRARDEFNIPVHIIVDSGYGYHLYTKIANELDIQTLSRLEKKYANVLGNDPKVAEPARIMRLPGTYNMKFYPLLVAPVKIVYMNIDNEPDHETLEKALDNTLAVLKREMKEETVEEEASVPAKRIRLTDREIRKIVELLKPFWFLGHRQNLEVYLSGFLWWKGVDKESFRKIIDIITVEANDEQRNKRLEDVDYLWNRAENQVDNIAGKNYLINEIENAIKHKNPTISDDDARDEAIKVVEEIEKIIRSRRYSGVLIRVPYETGVWFVNDPRRGIVLVRERERQDGTVVRRRKYITLWYISKVYVVKSGEQYYYKILFRHSRARNKKEVLSGSLTEIVKKMYNLWGITSMTQVRDALSALISEFISRGLAKYKKMPEAAGVYLNRKGRIVVVANGVISKLLMPKKVDIEKAKRALELLIKLREFYDTNKFDIVMNWATYAPLSYLLKKHYNIKQVYLFMHGEKQTGKSTLARIVRALYPVVSAETEETFEEGLSDYRLSYLMNLTTFPVLVDEIEGISMKKSLIAMVKRGATGIIARWRGDVNRVYKARAGLMFTSNRREVFSDLALLERLLLVEFDYNDYVYNKPREQLEEFKRVLNEYMMVAPHLGRVILETIKEKFEYIRDNMVYTLINKEDYLRLGKTLWTLVAEKLGVAPPPWTVASCELSVFEEDMHAREKEMVLDIIHDTVRELLLRLKNPVDGTLGEILTYFYERGLLPSWLHVKDDKLLVKSGIIREMKKRYDYEPIGGLKQLALRCGYTYTSYRIHGKSTKCMVIPLDEFNYKLVSLNMDNSGNDTAVYDDQTISLATEVDNVLYSKNLELTPQNVEKVLIEDLGMDREEAYKLRDKIYMLLKSWSMGNEY